VPPSLTIATLRETITTVPHTKPKGRPKHSGILWPSKRKHSKAQASLTSSKENIDTKKVKLSPDASGTPAHRSTLLREQKRIAVGTVDSKSVLIDITADGNDAICPDKPIVEAGGYRLYEADMVRVKKGSLNDSIMDFSQYLIQEKYSEVGGLQSVIHSRTLTFYKPKKSFVQILNCDDTHWVCATNIGCKQNVVKVYDSWRTGDVTSDAKESIANILQTNNPRIYILLPDVQQQKDGSSCGVFALAFASTLAEGKDPSCMKYPDDAGLRKHLYQCIVTKKITPFYSGQAKYNPGKPMKSIFKVYCTCRLQDLGDEMVFCNNCKTWFHFTCVGIAPETKLKAVYCCSACLSSN